MNPASHHHQTAAKTKPIPIKKHPAAESLNKSSSTSSPHSTSSSNASPKTSEDISYSDSPTTSIQTINVRPRAATTTRTNQPTAAAPMATGSASGATSKGPAAGGNASRAPGTGAVPKYAGASTASTAPYHHQIPSDILDDLASRFIINVPDDERNNLIRICFQIELAHWFYLDFFCANDEKKCGIKQFAMSLFQHIPFLKVHLATIDKILENWKQYKLTVPTYGAALLSEDLKYVLLVQSYWAKCSWGFPKGKVNENEDPVHCAAREVYEETGYDTTHLIVHSDYIESVINDQFTRLYLVCNVPLKTKFEPRTRKEIKCCEWFLIDSLPTSKNDANTKQTLGYNANSFFMIMPFIKRLKKWVQDKRNGGGGGKFAGQFGNIYNYNHPMLATGNKKTDTKLSFKSQIQGETHDSYCHLSNAFADIVSHDPYSNNKAGAAASNNKRQRHKSMGDLDGMIKSNPSLACNNNLRGGGTGVAAAASHKPTNIFNDLTVGGGSGADPNDHRIGRQGGGRRQKSTPPGPPCESNSSSRSSFYKIAEAGVVSAGEEISLQSGRAKSTNVPTTPITGVGNKRINANHQKTQTATIVKKNTAISSIFDLVPIGAKTRMTTMTALEQARPSSHDQVFAPSSRRKAVGGMSATGLNHFSTWQNFKFNRKAIVNIFG